MSKPSIVYFASNGLGENLQASPAMRKLRTKFHVLMVCRDPIHAVLDKECYDELFTWNQYNWEQTAYKLKVRISTTDDVLWTGHLDCHEYFLNSDLMSGGFLKEARREHHRGQTSASRAFWHRVVGAGGFGFGDPSAKELRMSAAPPDQHVRNDYDTLVSLGSGESIRRLHEPTAVAICNELNRRGRKVVLHTNSGRPSNLHSKVGCAMNRWNEGTISQLQSLLWGVDLMIGPDSGPVHLALAYGKKVIFMESREHIRNVIDAVHMPQATVWRDPKPACDQGCHARRPKFEEGKNCGPNYPWCLACAEKRPVPCLSLAPGQVVEMLASLDL